MKHRWSEMGWAFARSLVILLFGCWWVFIGIFCNSSELPHHTDTHRVVGHR